MEAVDAPVLTSTVPAGAGAAAAARPIETIVVEAFEAHAGRLRAFALAAVRDDAAADDLVQETFLRYVRHVKTHGVPDNVGGWLYRVCANLVISRGRRQGVAESFENLPDFELSCGVVYLTGTDFREGFRFYEDGLMVRRHVTADLEAIATLSPTGDGPVVRMTSHRNWWSVWPIPGGSDDEALYTQAGMDLKFSAPGLGASFQITGRFDPEGNHSGLFNGWSAEAMALLCEVLVE